MPRIIIALQADPAIMPAALLQERIQTVGTAGKFKMKREGKP